MLNRPYSLKALVAQRETATSIHMPELTKIALESFRCFSDRQEARLAPLTFLVGDNSTGKTSFLALIRALWNTVLLAKVPDFTEAPFQLGAFQDIINTRNGDTQRLDASFRTELSFVPERSIPIWKDGTEVQAFVEFRERVGIPFPTIRKFSSGSTFVALLANESSYSIRCKAGSSDWDLESQQRYPLEKTLELLPVEHLFFDFINNKLEIDESVAPAKQSEADLTELMLFLQAIGGLRLSSGETFASAPVRSRPRRTYDLGRPSIDPEGENIPTYLASMKSRSDREWADMERKLESLGHVLGLFDKIKVNSLTGGASGPFQIEIKRHGVDSSSPSRNLIDVGYGVSQILPLLTELVRDSTSSVCLLQQPEIHLHPSAQAALGTLFAEICSRGRQLIVETHSDYLINRVRMDIRDRQCKINENDVSILYFESVENGVEIHSIRIDKMGNVLGAPPSYRRFFTDETHREVQF